MKKLKMKLYGKKWKLVFRKGNYSNNYNTAIDVWGYKILKSRAIPFCDLTVNLQWLRGKIKEAYIDVNNCPEAIIKELTDRGLIIPTDIKLRSGFVEYPLYTLTDKFLNEWCMPM